MNQREELAHEMYDDYCTAVGGKAFNGDVLPPSTEFFKDPAKSTQANAWRKAADTAIAYFNKSKRNIPEEPGSFSHAEELG